MTPRFQKRWKDNKKLPGIPMVGSFLFSLFFLWIGLKVWNWISPPLLSTEYSKEILYSDGSLMHAFLSPDQKWRLQASGNQIPVRMKEWIEWKEDKYFRFHPGFNPVSILQSLVRNISSGKRKSGASTLTMQISRLRHQNPRGWKSKLLELVDALRLETEYSKEELLQFYLNHLPFGGNVEGFRAASLLYFGKEPKSLSPGQMAALLVIPNHPGKYHPLIQTQALEQKRNQFLEKLNNQGKISDEELRIARLEPLFPKWHPLPKEGPHLAQTLQLFPENPVLTTLDKHLQRQMETLLVQSSVRLKKMGIPNSSCLLTETRTGAIRAWVGNPDFKDLENSGQVDGIRAIRSPGSTLKPFIYALALQKGKITPGSILYDIPQDFAGYQPENYDQEFHGAVTAETALLQSLNLPTVGLLREIGVDSFVAFLDHLGMKTISQKTKKPGLSLAIGGCGTTLFELVQAYGALANGGIGTKLFATQSTKPETGKTQLHPASCEMVRKMLAVGNRSEAIFPFVKDKLGSSRIAWKTGTSFGRRDAWCIGFGNRMTLGIWLGNFKGQGNAGLSGIDVASPLFQRLMLQAEKPENRIPTDSFLTKSGWRKRRVCPATGMVPGSECPDRIWDWYLPLYSSNVPCTHLRKVETNKDETISYCLYCRPETGTHWMLADNRSPVYLNYLSTKQRRWKTNPMHNPACPQTKTGVGLSLLSPANDRVYFLEGENAVSLPIQVVGPSENFPVVIFLNGKKIMELGKEERRIWKFEAGSYQISAVDNTGNSVGNQFRVQEF